MQHYKKGTFKGPHLPPKRKMKVDQMYQKGEEREKEEEQS